MYVPVPLPLNQSDLSPEPRSRIRPPLAAVIHSRPFRVQPAPIAFDEPFSTVIVPLAVVVVVEPRTSLTAIE